MPPPVARRSRRGAAHRTSAPARPRAANPRALALEVLARVERGAASNRALDDVLERHPEVDARDRGLAVHLVYGVLRHRARLDHLIDAIATTPHKLRGRLRTLLRMGALELRELDHPAPIAIAEAVKVARGLEGDAEGVVPLIHAVLAGIDRAGADLDHAAESAAPLVCLDQRWSIPRWLAGRWIKLLGPERALARARAMAEPAPLELRVDLTRTTATQARERLLADHPRATVELVDGSPQALRVVRGGDLFRGPLHDEGLVSVQSLAAQQPALALAPRAGERVLDLCAGLGVKTLQLAELMGREGLLVAADLDGAKLATHADLRRRGRLAGTALALHAVEADLAAPEQPALDGVVAGAGYDAVLLDAPCTGLGNLRRHPEIRWVRRYEDIADRAGLQLRIAQMAAARVRPGGRLVYAVCSLEPEEGPAIVAALAGAGVGLELELEQALTPELDGTDGFYFARLRRGG